MGLGFLDEHEMDPGRARFRAEATVEADNPKQDENEVTYAEAGIRLGQQVSTAEQN